MKRLITIALAAIALAMILVSCNKDGDKNTGLGFWQVESEDANNAGYSNLYHAWYFYEEGRGYSILFLPKDDKDNWSSYDYAYVDMPESKVGSEHNLSDDLSDAEAVWAFYAGTKTREVGNKKFEGTVFLSVNREKNNVIFRLNGTGSNGDKVKIDYIGYASPVDSRPYMLL